MQLARVIGDIVATRKEPGFEGIALLVIQPVAADGTDVGRPLVAVDSVGAGVGETVFFVRGKEASFPFLPTEVPADAGIVGIVDHWSTDARSARASDEGQDERVAVHAQGAKGAAKGEVAQEPDKAQGRHQPAKGQGRYEPGKAKGRQGR